MHVAVSQFYASTTNLPIAFTLFIQPTLILVHLCLGANTRLNTIFHTQDVFFDGVK